MSKQKSNEKTSLSIAKEFIKGQFAIMKKFGSIPKLTDDEYQKLLKDTQRSFERLESAKS